LSLPLLLVLGVLQPLLAPSCADRGSHGAMARSSAALNASGWVGKCGVECGCGY
jgi:hypothetical protein